MGGPTAQPPRRMSAPPSPPLTHHQILALVAPFTRSGRTVDLAASDRLALWQAQWQQVQNQWEKMAKTLIPLMDNASVLESVYAQRSLALHPPPTGADGGIERQHRGAGRA